MATTTMTRSRTRDSASVHEMQPVDFTNNKPSKSYQVSLRSSQGSTPNNEEDGVNNGPGLPVPSTAVTELQRWNYPPRNKWGTAATFYSFLCFGLNDGSYGPLIPYLERYYGLTYTVVSLIFLSPFLGYTVAALMNNMIHMHFGQRGIAVIAPSCRFVTYLIFCFHPPYPVLVVLFAVAGFGNGLEDAGWCAWTGNMVSANKVQGFMQACYSLGALLSPLIATTMIDKAGLEWYSWYYVMTALVAIELAACTWAFWHKSGTVYRAENPRTSESEGSRTKEAMRNKVTWLISIFFFGYVGAEVSLGGWIVTFMNRVRGGSPYASGLSATGFWAGMTVGRASLGFVTEKYGERLCVSIYIAISLALELIFWLVPNFTASAVAAALLGVFLGPLFPAGIVVAAKLLPQHLHVSALGFSTALGGTGGAILPFAIGAAAESRGVQVFQPFVLSFLAAIAGIWLVLPRIQKRREV